ncbi:MAG: hypothetical protein ACYDC1_23765 [Limisphaerales bacterium]
MRYPILADALGHTAAAPEAARSALAATIQAALSAPAPAPKARRAKSPPDGRGVTSADARHTPTRSAVGEGKAPVKLTDAVKAAICQAIDKVPDATFGFMLSALASLPGHRTPSEVKLDFSNWVAGATELPGRDWRKCWPLYTAWRLANPDAGRVTTPDREVKPVLTAAQATGWDRPAGKSITVNFTAPATGSGPVPIQNPKSEIQNPRSTPAWLQRRAATLSHA